MPIFKVVMVEQVSQTFTAYVEAETAADADNWASMIEVAGRVGKLTREEISDGSVEDIDPVEEVPAGYKLNVPA